MNQEVGRQRTASEVLRLFAETDLTKKEIAERLSIQPATVGRIIRKARIVLSYDRISRWHKVIISARASGVAFPGMDEMAMELEDLRHYCAARGRKNAAEDDFEFSDDRETALLKAAEGMNKYVRDVALVTTDLELAMVRAMQFKKILEDF